MSKEICILGVVQVCFSFGLPPLNLEIVIVPVFLLQSLVDVRIHTCDASSWHCRVLLLSQSGGESEESIKKEEGSLLVVNG